MQRIEKQKMKNGKKEDIQGRKIMVKEKKEKVNPEAKMD